MSVRLSTTFPRACSGDMYAAVPRTIPASVSIARVSLRSVRARGVRDRLGQAEVEDLHGPVRRELDVGRFQIAVDDAFVMRRFERIGHLPGSGQRLIEGKRTAPNPCREVLALDQLHHERADLARLFESMNVRDVCVIEGRQRFGFAFEAREPIGIGRESLRQDLQRDVAIEVRIAGAIHLAHGAGAEWSEDRVGAESRPGSERHDAHYTGLERCGRWAGRLLRRLAAER